MSALDKMSSLDDLLRTVKDEHQREMQQLKDQLFATQTELTLCKDSTERATADRDRWMRIATKLVTQFSTVETVFAEAKRIALSMPETAEERADGLSEAVAGIERLAEGQVDAEHK